MPAVLQHPFENRLDLFGAAVDIAQETRCHSMSCCSRFLASVRQNENDAKIVQEISHCKYGPQFFAGCCHQDCNGKAIAGPTQPSAKTIKVAAVLSCFPWNHRFNAAMEPFRSPLVTPGVQEESHRIHSLGLANIHVQLNAIRSFSTVWRHEIQSTLVSVE
jgi:hypothetical protein